MRHSLALLALVLGMGCASAGSSRDVLLRIVTDCLDTGAPRYCARCGSPQAGTCDLQYPCTRTTEVWAQSEEYVAIRDLKMCGCPDGFVHGLAMPRYPVNGPEDPRRPVGLWRFGWDVARTRIRDEREIALLVNPPYLRTQDQLHVHLVRLLPGARARIDGLGPTRIERLEDVWPVAEQHAAGRGLTAYGVIVVQALDRGWLVAAEAGSTETAFTVARCQAADKGPAASLASLRHPSTYREYASGFRGARRLASGPFLPPWPVDVAGRRVGVGAASADPYLLR